MTMTRDQLRAQRAFAAVQRVADGPPDVGKEYKTAVFTLGTNVMRSGLVAALSFIQRQPKKAAQKQLMADLAVASIPGLACSEGEDPMVKLPDLARNLDLESYMLATREILKVAQWMKRAVQALLGERED